MSRSRKPILRPVRIRLEQLEDRLAPASLSELTATTPDAVSYVSALYQELLDRPADRGGMNNWVGRLATGASRSDVAASVLASPEYVGRSGDWVGSLYQDVLGRSADGGRASHDAQLASGVPRDAIAHSFLDCAEFSEQVSSFLPPRPEGPPLPKAFAIADTRGFVLALYEQVLGRPANPGGLASTEARLAAGVSRIDVAATILASPEYVGRAPDWVAALYRDALGRVADAAGVASHTAQLAAGTSRVEIARGFLTSGEFQALVAAAVANPNPGGLGGNTDPAAPRVVGAGSTGNRSVLVSFSEAMSDSALDPLHYSVTQNTVNPEAGRLRVLSVAFRGDRTAVELTTEPQSEVNYTVSVVNVKDLGGTPLASAMLTSGGLLVDPTRASFQGTAPSGPDDLRDSDGDGLSDSEEQRGFTRGVTSDPTLADTDGDGFSDADEATLRLDPRDADTDDDKLTDNQEFNEIFSDPANQDTDGDGLDDGLEFNFFRTAPTQKDTDGDQIPDGEEVLLANRNARVADLPAPAIEVNGVNLQLDVRFVETTSTQTRELEARSVSSTLTQTESKEQSNSNESTITAEQKLTVTTGLEVGVGVSIPPDVDTKVNMSTEVETSTSGSWTGTWTETSRQETQRQYQESLNREAETTEGANVERQVAGARMQVGVFLKNVGTVSYRVQNLQVTVFIQDPQDPSNLTPIATLLPDSSPAEGFTLGPLVPQHGPVIFSSDTVFPNLVDNLMANPRGLVFRLSNYDVVDELGRNFAFTARDVIDRTGSVLIDFGGYDSDGDGEGDLTEYHRVATSAGREVDGHRIVFDADGKQVGITLREALAAIGLTHYDENETPTASLTERERRNSYSTVTATANGHVYEQIFRIRDTAIEEGVRKSWEIITPTGIDRTLTLDDYVVRTDSDVKLAFVQDVDNDGLPATLEFLNGTSDDAVDSDGDGLDDRFEALVGWTVEIDGRGSYHVLSSGTLADTDGDGLNDGAEAPGLLARNERGLIISAMRNGPDDAVTDPLRPDTDRDGIGDNTEVVGFPLTLRNGTELPLVQTNPADPDSDDDTASDGVEVRLGGNPNDKNDKDLFSDDDRDGLVNVEETDGWDVIVQDRSGTPGEKGPESTRHVQSEPGDADSDDDGLSDGEEFLLKTDPNNSDTDGDGLTDFQEVRGIRVRDLGIITLSPTDADFDNDGLTDGAEAELTDVEANRWVVRVHGKDPRRVFSDPRFADADFDGLLDGDERAQGSDPNMANTDGDGRDDAAEFAAGTDPLREDFRVVVLWESLFIDEDSDPVGTDAGDIGFDLWVRKPDDNNILGIAPRGAALTDAFVEQFLPPGTGQPSKDLFTEYLQQNFTQPGIGIPAKSTLNFGDFLSDEQRAVSFGVAKDQRFMIEAEVRELDYHDGGEIFGVTRANLGGLSGSPAQLPTGEQQRAVWEGGTLMQGFTEVTFGFNVDGGTLTEFVGALKLILIVS